MLKVGTGIPTLPTLPYASLPFPSLPFPSLLCHVADEGGKSGSLGCLLLDVKSDTCEVDCSILERGGGAPKRLRPSYIIEGGDSSD